MINEYVLILFWIGLMALIAPSFYREEIVIDRWEWRVSLGFAVAVFIPLIWMAAHRGYFADTTIYLMGYHSAPTSLAQLPAYIVAQKKDAGYGALSGFLHILLGNNDVLFLGIIAAIQCWGLVSLFRNYSSNYILSAFLFVASADYISWMYNGLRQFIAVTLMLLATGLMIRKRYVRVLIVILIAATMHQSALIMIPFVIISQGEAWNKKTLLFMAGAILAVAFVGRFTTLLDTALQSTQYGNVVSDYKGMNDDGTNPLRVAVYCVPALLSLYGRKTIKAEHNPVINFCTNMSIISAGIYIVSMVTSGVFLGRLPIYVSLFGYVLLPWEIDNLFPQNRQFVKMGCIGAYLIYYYYQMHLTYGLF